MIERNNKIKWNKITFEEKRKIYLCKSELTLFKWNEINYVKERVKKNLRLDFTLWFGTKSSGSVSIVTVSLTRTNLVW